MLFNYIPVGGGTSVYPDVYQNYNTFCGNGGLTTSNASPTLYNNQTLQSIDFSNGHLQFMADASRSDLNGASKLDSVVLYSKNSAGALTYLKQNNFYYSYFNQTYASGPDSFEYKRLRLDSVKEKSGGLSLPPYSFLYNNPNPGSGSAKHSFSVDHWGYYNGAANGGYSNGTYTGNLIPSSTIDFNSFLTGQASSIVTFSGANRESDPVYVQTFSLQQIKYPTGGSSVFSYQLNDYDHQNSITGPNDLPNVTTVTVDSVINVTHHGTTSGTIDLTYIFPQLYAGSPQSNLTIKVSFIYQNNYTTNFPYSNTSNKLTFSFTGTGQNLFQDVNGATCQSGSPACSVNITTAIIPPGKYNWSAYIDPTAIDTVHTYSETHIEFQYQVTQQVYNQQINNNFISNASGLRIQNIINYTSAGIAASEKSYTYTYSQDKLGTGTPQTYSYGRLMSFPSYAHYVYNFNQGPPSNICYGLNLFSSSNTALSSVIQGNIVGYDQVTEASVDPSSGLDIGKTVYKYFNSSDSTFTYSGFRLPGCLNMGNSLNGMLLSKIDYSNVGGIYQKVSETDNFYHTTNRIVYNSPKYQYFHTLAAKITTGCPVDTAVEVETFACFYPSLKSERILSDSNYDYSYDQLNPSNYLLKINRSYYDNPIHYQVTRQNTNDSKGNTLVSQIKYPQDYIPSGQTIWTTNTILDSLIGHNMVAEVIEKRDSLYYTGTTTGKVTGANLSKYKTLTAGVMGKDKIYRLDQTGPVGDFQPYAVNGNSTTLDSRYRQLISFDSYDNANNIAQYTAVDQIPVSIIWDYKNHYPVAQAKNAIVTDVAFTSFEADGNGNWNVTSSTRDSINFFTGKKSYNLSIGSISKSGLVSGSVYMVTYWSRNGSYSISGGTTTSRTGRAVNGWTYYEQTVTTTSTTITITGSGNIDELRLFPQAAQMTSYTYAPLAGVTTMNDPNSEISYYEYDSLQRLRNVKDYMGNILNNFQYNYAQGCTSCSVPLQTFAHTLTLSYPVGVFSVANKLLGNATTPAQYLSLWNGDANDHTIGTLAAGSDSLHFNLTVNSGQSSPGFVTGCRYYQFDLPFTQIDAVRNSNGVYVDYGDGFGMFLGKTIGDSNVVRAPNTVINVQTNSAGPHIYWIHSYPDNSTKTLTFYHNDALESMNFDDAFAPATSLTLLRNFRGILPQNTQSVDANCFQQSSAYNFSAITNWNSINSVLNWALYVGDLMSPCLHISFAQDFMANNKNLQSIITNSYGYYAESSEDTTFKISKLKSTWNTYFTNLTTLEISDDDWNREDLSQLPQLNLVGICAGNTHHSYNQSNNPLVPIPTSAIDNIINQVGGGAGTRVSNGLLNILSGGTARSSASNSGITQLKSKGWTVIVNGVTQ